jgi:hypothetical protein
MKQFKHVECGVGTLQGFYDVLEKGWIPLLKQNNISYLDVPCFG